ncbi:hypothetical protein LZF95_00445 [Algoriphagus sp. AGSA1]|uniref:hypothetical protein n=1 Tax=Algoriphagus sp. AGSA1 TaxID=2907213 RepID=UPI001F46B3C3|nr:hypothetical protein [Algoriphagus sp. AGSA1]MCE7053122.1 hypothetical protein [Algoriphagus sp. AGSA1]
MHFVIDYNLTQKSTQAMEAKDRFPIVRYPLPDAIPPGQQFAPLDYILHFFKDRYTIYEAHYLLETLSLSVKGKSSVAYWDPQEGVNVFVNDFSRLLHAAHLIRNEPSVEPLVGQANRKTETGSHPTETFPFLPETNRLMPEIDPWHFLRNIFEKYSLPDLLYLILHWGSSTSKDAEIPRNISENHNMDDAILNLILDCCGQIYARNSKKDGLPDVLGKFHMFRK